MAPPPGIRIPELRFDSDGRWFIDGALIEHARSVQVLTQNLRVLDDGSFVSSIGREIAPVIVDDVAFFVLDCEVAGGALRLTLSDGTQDSVTEPRLELDSRGRLYVLVKNGLAWARFQRGVQQRLEPHWVECGEAVALALGDRFVLPRQR